MVIQLLFGVIRLEDVIFPRCQVVSTSQVEGGGGGVIQTNELFTTRLCSMVVSCRVLILIAVE